MNRRYWQSIYHGNVDVNLMEENVIQISGEITKNVDKSVKKSMYVECMWKRLY